MAERRRILVLDGDMLPALTIARSLGRRGLQIVVASHEPKPIASYSRYVERSLPYPDPLQHEAAFVDWCETQVTSGEFDLVIPVTERTVVPMQHLLSHPNGATLAIAPPAALAIALDKARTLALAEQQGVPTPHSVLIEHDDDIATQLETVQTPVVIKPSHSIGSDRSQRQHLSVDYAFNKRQLETKTRHYLRYGSVLWQTFFRGKGVGIELIADRGEIVFAFQHLRLHEVPLTGGGSSLRVSVAPEPELLDAAQRLMRALQWHGVAMVEFKWQPDTRRFALMEINGRFWGSLPLAVAAGADFPLMLFELLTQGRVAPRAPASPGVYCRKLSSDLAWLELVLRREAPAELVQLPTASEIFRDGLRIFSPRHSFDAQQWRDPVPGIIDLGRIARDYVSRIGRLVRDRAQLWTQQRAWRSGRVARLTQHAGRILFLCYGNINRSAVAERYFASLSPHGPAAISAGFHDEDGRGADPVMVDVAAETGIDMTNWSSRRLTREMLASSDVVFVMELRHLQQIRREFPEAADKTFLLGMATADSLAQGEIHDPYGKAVEEYRACVAQIIQNLQATAAYLAVGQKS